MSTTSKGSAPVLNKLPAPILDKVSKPDITKLSYVSEVNDLSPVSDKDSYEESYFYLMNDEKACKKLIHNYKAAQSLYLIPLHPLSNLSKATAVLNMEEASSFQLLSYPIPFLVKQPIPTLNLPFITNTGPSFVYFMKTCPNYYLEFKAY
ncbi:hypothetical protein BB561_000021 [Smittium simulii]|uniref:Uncharacterized protein n=1 Tax=Smittium simulii TaxID=133385 RepID=A0A2T9Z0X2_9FUNG|nr:hypothetical protein BB561_002441 [Smittium simulii]PVU97783.1 hypothetical protein BB561_000335 [Smittium simulii]PVU98252.1 hypothetical protein BB561_000021 [Smittium simulii]